MSLGPQPKLNWEGGNEKKKGKVKKKVVRILTAATRLLKASTRTGMDGKYKNVGG